MTNSPQTILNIVVLGGGFGGVHAARKLSRQSGVKVTLISNLSTFAYYPQLYHTASGGSRSESALPLVDLLADTGIQLVQDVITTIDPATKTVGSINGTSVYHYDKLIMALGSVTNYFGITGLKDFSYGIKSIVEAEEFKKHLHDQLLADKQLDLNYVVVGGGPTGIELSGALGAYLRRITNLHGLEWRAPNITLVEAAPRLLPRSTESVSARAKKRLESLGVKVLTGAVVKGETADSLQLADQAITTRTVAWTAGIATNPFYYANGAHFQLAKGGRVMVNDHLEAKDDVYVIGDNATTMYGGLAMTAVQQAAYVAEDIKHIVGGGRRPAFKPSKPISVLPIGENWAIAEYGQLHLFGYPAWLLRRAADLIGYADIETWPKAFKVWRLDKLREDNCQICSASIDKIPQQV